MIAIYTSQVRCKFVFGTHSPVSIIYTHICEHIRLARCNAIPSRSCYTSVVTTQELSRVDMRDIVTFSLCRTYMFHRSCEGIASSAKNQLVRKRDPVWEFTTRIIETHQMYEQRPSYRLHFYCLLKKFWTLLTLLAVSISEERRHLELFE